MAFAKGRTKTGGRRYGSVNKRTRVFEVCKLVGIDPFLELAKIAHAHDDPGLRFSAIKELCSYLEPKKKAIEHSTPEDHEIRIIVSDYSVNNGVN